MVVTRCGMNRIRSVAIAVTGFIALVSMPNICRASWVCEKPSDLADAVRRYPVVFIGTAESISDEVIGFTVVENFGITLPKNVQMNRSQNAGYGFRFIKGRMYLVFTTQSDKAGLLEAASACNRTSSVGEAKEDIASLRAQQASSKR